MLQSRLHFCCILQRLWINAYGKDYIVFIAVLELVKLYTWL